MKVHCTEDDRAKWAGEREFLLLVKTFITLISVVPFPSVLNLYISTNAKVMNKSNLKQKCSQLLISFSGMVFHTFSRGGIHFAQCVTFKNQFSKLLIGCYFWNTVPKNSVINSVHFCLQPLERCAVSIQYSSPVDFNRLPVDCWNLLALTAAMLCCVCCHTKTLQANNSDQEKNVLQFPP